MRERYVVINGSINGKELSVSTKKNPERKLQAETHTVIGKAAGDFQNQQKIQNEYSVAAKPSVRKNGNHLSG